MRRIFLVILSSSVFLVAGCAANAAMPEPFDRVTSDMAMEAPVAPIPEALYQEQGAKAMEDGSGKLFSSVERIVIKNAYLEIAVPDPAESMDAIGKMAEKMGGFVVSSNLYKTTTSQGIQVPEASITVRVPADQLTIAMDTIKALVTKPEENILSESVEGQDVTKEYTDLKSRLSNAEKTEKKLTEIMEDATKTEDVLAVYNQLIQVQEQIEILKGQIQYYEEASSLSSIQVTLRSEASIVPITIGGWKPQGIARDAVQALIDTLKGIANVTIWLVIFCLPISILITIPGYFIFKTFRKWQAKRKAKKAAADSNKE